MTPALFLDRDGVINVDDAYVHRIADFVFMPGIFELVRAARALGWPTVVVTNQAGIGRGMYTAADFATLTDWMCARFRDEGAPIARVYHCPTHPTHGVGAYRIESPMRKPAPGMLLQARDDWQIDMPRSVLVGDKADDIAAGRAAGVGLNLWLQGRYPAPAAGAKKVATLADAQARMLAFAGQSEGQSTGPSTDQAADQSASPSAEPSASPSANKTAGYTAGA